MTQAQTDIEPDFVPMADRCILSFLGRNSRCRGGDAELAAMLEHPHSQQVGNVMLHPNRVLHDITIGEQARRFFLDAGNNGSAIKLRKQIDKLRAKQAPQV